MHLESEVPLGMQKIFHREKYQASRGFQRRASGSWQLRRMVPWESWSLKKAFSKQNRKAEEACKHIGKHQDKNAWNNSEIEATGSHQLTSPIPIPPLLIKRISSKRPPQKNAPAMRIKNPGPYPFNTLKSDRTKIRMLTWSGI